MNQDKIIVLYQSDCQFCNWCKELVLRHDAKNLFEFVPITSLIGADLIVKHQLKINQNHPISIAVMGMGSDFEPKYKWRACLEIAKHTSGKLKLLGILFSPLPSWLGDRAYDLAGRHRGLLCRMVHCVSK